MSENFALPKRPIAVQVMSAAVSGIRWALLAGILIILAPYGLAFVDNARGYAATARILEYQEQMVRGASPRLQQYVPTRISGKDRTDWILAAGLAAFAIVLGSLRDRVVSTVTARQMRSQLGRWKDAGEAAATLVIGGPDGLDPALQAEADLTLSFGALTWPHQLVRIMLAEQLYRATTILSGHPYHRE